MQTLPVTCCALTHGKADLNQNELDGQLYFTLLLYAHSNGAISTVTSCFTNTAIAFKEMIKAGIRLYMSVILSHWQAVYFCKLVLGKRFSISYIIFFDVHSPV